ncbi:Serine/threonine-protein kinase PrkC [Phycisphaerae bacterium RAS1]|nr:Serine/threonine-protein kinase PrkC [Phycisphaerae bacterium RAS1]
MDARDDAMIDAVLDRFRATRDGGQRVSIDKVLEGFPTLSQRPDVRIAAIKRLSQNGRRIVVRSGSADDTLAAAAPAGGFEIPALEGYDFIDVIGRGGMGMVYEAYQQSTGRRVAVKFMLDSATAGEASRRRFEREVELAARLQHPNIVSVLDSGLHHGSYYYVMDFIDGRPLDRAFPPGQTDIRDVLRVVRHVAEAVDYAHQRGVLHRDLKPSNILIDSHGRPRLLDFGLAKSIDSSAAAHSMTISQPGQVLGTLAYMPPEQAGGRGEDVSVRSDVYSLGALTYELVTGRIPCPIDGPLGETLRRIAEQDPPRASSIRKRVDLDVDAILMKALEKHPQSRYATASDFAADIDRYLNDRSIVARHVGPATHLLRWVRRNRRLTITSAIALAALVTAAWVKAAQFVADYEADQVKLRQAERDGAETHRQLDLALRVNTALSALLRVSDPASARTQSLEDALDRAASEVEQTFAADADVRAGVHHELGRLYLARNIYGKAERELRAAYALWRGQLGENSRQYANAAFDLGRALHESGRTDEALPLYDEALQVRMALLGADSPDVAEVYNYQAWLHKDRSAYDLAVPLYEKALKIRALKLGYQSAALAESLNDYGQLFVKKGEDDQAEPRLRQALSIRQALAGGKPDREVASSMATLGAVLNRLGRGDEAEPLVRDALDMRLTLYGDKPHGDIVNSLNQLAELLADRREYADAEDLYRRALDMRRQIPGVSRSKLAVSEVNLGTVLVDRAVHPCGGVDAELLTEAESHTRAALDLWHGEYGDKDDGNLAAGLDRMANLLCDGGRWDEAEGYATQALEMRRRLARGENSRSVGDSTWTLGRVQLARGDAAAALVTLEAAWKIHTAKPPIGHYKTWRTQATLAAALVALGNMAEAEPLLAPATGVLVQDQQGHRADAVAALRRLAELYEKTARPELAAETLARANELCAGE